MFFVEQLRHEAAKRPAGTGDADGYGGLGDAEREMGGPAYSIGGRDSRSFAAGDLFRSGQFGTAISATGNDLAGGKLYQAADTSRKVETTRTDYVEQKAEQQIERLALKGNVRSPTWGLYGIAVLLLVCFLYRRIRKRE